MLDPFGRHITYLRVSVTDRCDFRCIYCMPEHMHFLPKREVLTLEELDRLCSAFIAKGVERIRLTGGEPLVRRDLMTLLRSLGRKISSGLRELTLTTNGSQLARYADEITAAGIRRVNVSLDTRDADKFRAITRGGNLSQVLAGIAAARAAGLAVKINTVALRGLNEDEIPSLIAWTHGDGMDITLIETMPMGDSGDDRTEHYLPLSLMRAQLARHYTLEETDYRTGGPARYVRVRETGGRLGFITPLTHNFCESPVTAFASPAQARFICAWARTMPPICAAPFAPRRMTRCSMPRLTKLSRANPRAMISSSTADTTGLLLRGPCR